MKEKFIFECTRRKDSKIYYVYSYTPSEAIRLIEGVLNIKESETWYVTKLGSLYV